MTRIEVHVDPELCCASGGCVALAPEHFHLSDLGHATPAKSSYKLGALELLRQAEECCPYGAITVVSDEGAG